MARFENRIPPPILWVLASAVTWIVAAADLDRSPLEGIAARVLGLVVALLGVAVALAGLMEFGKAHTSIDPHRIEEASVLVTTGVYRLTRNPMYLGLTLLSIGWGLWLGTVVGMVVGTGLLIWALTVLQIRPEERVLEQKFGPAYAGYTSRVRRWI